MTEATAALGGMNPHGRCGIDTVEIARIERLLQETPAADLRRLFSSQELADSGDGPGRAASLAARFAAKEACLKLFPRETALGQIEAARIFRDARQLWRAAGRVQPGGRGASRAAPDQIDRHFTVARSHQRIGGGVGRARQRGGAAHPASSSTVSCR